DHPPPPGPGPRPAGRRLPDPSRPHGVGAAVGGARRPVGHPGGGRHLHRRRRRRGAGRVRHEPPRAVRGRRLPCRLPGGGGRPPGQGVRRLGPVVRRRPGGAVRPVGRPRRNPPRLRCRRSPHRRRHQPRGDRVILFLSTADTEILALRAAIEMLPDGFPPVRAGSPAALPAAPDLAGVDAVIVRLLGGRRAWEAPFDDLARRCAATGVALLAFGGEAALDPELTAASTVGAATIGAAFPYLLHGGPANTANLLRFVADEVLGASPPYGHAEPAPVPDEGVYRGGPDDPGFDPARPTVGVVFYRAHLLAGNTTFV